MGFRTATLVEDYDYVSKFDEAVDQSLPDFELRWKQYRDGVGEPPLIPGAKPVTFRLRHLGTAERMYLSSAESGHERLLVAAGLAIVGVENLGVEFRKDSSKFGPYKLVHAHAEVIAAIPVEALADVGSLVIERVNLRPS